MAEGTAGAPTGTHALRLHILGSGSKGNCALVEGPNGLIMIDCGLSRRETLMRLSALGLDEHDIRALILTHEHNDHIAGIEVWAKHFDGELYASTGTAASKEKLSRLPFRTFEPGDELAIAGVTVGTFPTAHDAADPAGFRFEHEGDAIGYATDTGHLTSGALELLAGARILAIESNHDVHMLKTGGYPRMLQERILSDAGHLSNGQAAEALPSLVTDRTEQVIAMHISQENNRPTLAVRTLAESLGATLDDEIGSSATLERAGAPGLHIRPASQVAPMSVC